MKMSTHGNIKNALIVVLPLLCLVISCASSVNIYSGQVREIHVPQLMNRIDTGHRIEKNNLHVSISSQGTFRPPDDEIRYDTGVDNDSDAWFYGNFRYKTRFSINGELSFDFSNYTAFGVGLESSFGENTGKRPDESKLTENTILNPSIFFRFAGSHQNVSGGFRSELVLNTINGRNTAYLKSGNEFNGNIYNHEMLLRVLVFARIMLFSKGSIFGGVQSTNLFDNSPDSIIESLYRLGFYTGFSIHLPHDIFFEPYISFPRKDIPIFGIKISYISSSQGQESQSHD